MKFQQLTGPVMAKGLEDTAFYRYFLLSSLNEVGGNPDLFGISLEEFHKENRKRAGSWPHTMLGSSTHDTKRSEDVRARINVLSELPEEWVQAVRKWMSINAQYKTTLYVNNQQILSPGPNEEYLLYQTITGAWPFGTTEATDEFKQRISSYMLKAAKEAKLCTRYNLLYHALTFQLGRP
jgi:(1->4)-alpha-D-glucan 1-alpha-D-glucosylmutase